MRTNTQRLTTFRTADTRPVDDEVVETAPVAQAAPVVTRRSNTAVNVVWYIAGLLMILLGFRFVLALLGANPSNGFANFIYTTSHPFVAPFFSLFSYDGTRYGISRFEVYTLVAMAVYAVVAWAIARLFTLNRPRTTTPTVQS